MDIIDRSTNPSAHWPGIRTWWGQNYDEHEHMYPQILTIRSSEQAHEEDVQMTGFGLAPVQKELEPFMMDTTNEGVKVVYEHIAYGLGYAVSREERADNLYDQVSSRRTPALLRSIVQTKEIIGHSPYNFAFDAVNHPHADGVALISASHPVMAGVQSNIVPVAVDISELAIEQIAIQIANFEDDRGLRINARPTKLLITPEQSFEAARILNSVLQSNSTSNNLNVLKAQNIIPEIVVSPYFDDKDAFFVLTTVDNGPCMFERTDLEIEENMDFHTSASEVKAYCRFSVGTTDWRSVIGSPGV